MTISAGELRSYYDQIERIATAVRPRIDEMLRAFASTQGFLYESRIKSFESYLEKLQTGRATTGRLADIFACSLVVTTLDDIGTCIDKLPKSVRVSERRGPESRKKEPDVFRFDDVVMDCDFLPAKAEKASITFELQVRTVLQYAWAKATHRLAYKADTIDWRRYRLAAQLRATAEQTDLLYNDFVRLASAVDEGRSEKIDVLIEIATTLERFLGENLIPGERRPTSLVRASESIRDLCSALGISGNGICVEVESYLKSKGYPIALTVVQVFSCVAIAKRWGQISWDAFARRRIRLLIVKDMEDLFPNVASVPERVRVAF